MNILTKLYALRRIRHYSTMNVKLLSGNDVHSTFMKLFPRRNKEKKKERKKNHRAPRNIIVAVKGSCGVCIYMCVNYMHVCVCLLIKSQRSTCNAMSYYDSLPFRLKVMASQEIYARLPHR